MTEEANDAIGQALEKWVESLPSADGHPIGILGDWACVMGMVDVDSDGDARVQYYLAMKSGTMLPHVLVGLLHEGLNQARLGRVGDSDDD